MTLLSSPQHDAGAVICDSDLSSQLKSAAYSALKRMEGDIQDEVPTLMSGAGHDAMAMSHLTKVTSLSFCMEVLRFNQIKILCPIFGVFVSVFWTKNRFF